MIEVIRENQIIQAIEVEVSVDTTAILVVTMSTGRITIVAEADIMTTLEVTKAVEVITAAEVLEAVKVTSAVMVGLVTVTDIDLITPGPQTMITPG